MNKKVFVLLFSLVIAVFLVSGIASASISLIKANKDRYNLGDELAATYSVNSSQDENVIFRLGLVCGSYSLDPYYVIPLSLKANEAQTINTKEMVLSSIMAGSCKTKAYITSYDDKELENLYSIDFLITNQLMTTISIDKTDYDPGSNIIVSGKVNYTYEKFTNAAVIMGIDNNVQTFTITNPSFTRAINTSDTIKSNIHSVFIKLNDSYGNVGDAAVNINIIPRPTTIDAELNGLIFDPGQTIQIKIILKDQADDLIQKEAAYDITNTKGEKIVSRKINVGLQDSFTFSQFALPGEYNLIVYAGGKEKEFQLKINTVEKVDITFDGRYVYIRNIGNIDYNKPIDITLSRNGVDYKVTEQISLKPNEVATIDIFKQVPASNYDLRISLNNGSSYEFGNIVTQDERSLLKKASDVFNPVTGQLTSNNSNKSNGSRIWWIISVSLALVAIAGIAAYFIYFRGASRQKGIIPERVQEISEQEKSEEEEIKRMIERKKVVEQKEKSLSRDDPQVKRYVDSVLKETEMKKK